jgi:hypothetical protein
MSAKTFRVLLSGGIGPDLSSFPFVGQHAARDVLIKSSVAAVLISAAFSLEACAGFVAAGTYPVFNGLSTVVMEDFNGDGIPDLAAIGFSGVSILLGKGDGTFEAAQNYATGSFTCAFRERRRHVPSQK